MEFPKEIEELGWNRRQWIANRYIGACVTGQHQEMDRILKSISEEERVQLEKDIEFYRGRS